MFKISFDPTWDYVPVVIWTELEVCACFICVSVPSIRALIMRFIPQSIKDKLKLSITSKNRSRQPDPRRDLPGGGKQWHEPNSWVSIPSKEIPGQYPPGEKGGIRGLVSPLSSSHSRYAQVQHDEESVELGITRKREVNVSITKPETSRPPSFRKIDIPTSRFSVQPSSRLPSRQSHSSAGLTVGCLPDRTYSNENLKGRLR